MDAAKTEVKGRVLVSFGPIVEKIENSARFRPNREVAESLGMGPPHFDKVAGAVTKLKDLFK